MKLKNEPAFPMIRTEDMSTEGSFQARRRYVRWRGYIVYPPANYLNPYAGKRVLFLDGSASGEIIPETYYKYASPWALDELWSYIREWKAAHTTAAGTLTVDRYGIIEREVPCSGNAAGSPANSPSG